MYKTVNGEIYKKHFILLLEFNIIKHTIHLEYYKS
jgi:hypothetical protein